MFCWGDQWVQVKLEFVSMCVILINLVANHLHTFMHTMALNGSVCFMILWQNTGCRIIHLTATYTTAYTLHWLDLNLIEHLYNMFGISLTSLQLHSTKAINSLLENYSMWNSLKRCKKKKRWFYLSRNVNLKEYLCILNGGIPGIHENLHNFQQGGANCHTLSQL